MDPIYDPTYLQCIIKCPILKVTEVLKQMKILDKIIKQPVNTANKVATNICNETSLPQENIHYAVIVSQYCCAINYSGWNTH